MLEATGEPVCPTAVVRVDIDYRGQLATYWVDREGFSLPVMAHFFAHAGDLLADLRALEALDLPTEGSLVQRVARHARTVAAEPQMEAAIGFIDRNGETGLVRVTGVGQRPQPSNKE